MQLERSSIYLEYLGRHYKVAHIVPREDGSIYIYFPRKNGYVLKHLSSISVKRGYQTMSLDNRADDSPRTQLRNIYVSFHPGKGAVHMKATVNNDEQLSALVNDSPTVVSSEIENKEEYYPLISMLIPPSPTMFDRSTEKKSKALYVFRKRALNCKHGLYVEVFVHSKNGSIHKDDLPYAEARNLLQIVPYEHGLSTNKTVTIVFSQVPIKRASPIQVVDYSTLKEEITIIIASKSDPTVLCLEANSSNE